jgi:hypothetical protein
VVLFLICLKIAVILINKFSFGSTTSQNQNDSEMSPSIFINHRTLKNDKKINNFKPGAPRIKLLRTETTVDDEIEEQQQHIPFMILMEHVYISRHRESFLPSPVAGE